MQWQQPLHHRRMALERGAIAGGEGVQADGAGTRANKRGRDTAGGGRGGKGSGAGCQTATALWHWCTSSERRVVRQVRATFWSLALFQTPARDCLRASGKSSQKAAIAPRWPCAAMRRQRAPAKSQDAQSNLVIEHDGEERVQIQLVAAHDRRPAVATATRVSPAGSCRPCSGAQSGAP